MMACSSQSGQGGAQNSECGGFGPVQEAFDNLCLPLTTLKPLGWAQDNQKEGHKSLESGEEAKEVTEQEPPAEEGLNWMKVHTCSHSSNRCFAVSLLD